MELDPGHRDPFETEGLIPLLRAILIAAVLLYLSVLLFITGRRLFAIANEPKELAVIPAGDHDIIGSPEVGGREVAFFRKWMKAQ